ncbi:MAG: ChbG/HpnK family deacetylase [Elusimicrobia bacterium]|nr:ChbG/HpnK family deacetylase [Elusimicrobiota bacterium]
MGPAPRRLIVTADDFGSTPGVNEAVEASHRRGILRFASLMVRGAAVRDAVRVARANPGLGVGVHLDLCEGGCAAAWGLRQFLRRGRGLEEEIDSQLRLCLSLGVRPTHLDSHLNVHVHPTVFPMVARAALRHGIGRIRLTGGELGLRLGFGLGGLLPSLAMGCVFGCLRSWLKGPRAPAALSPQGPAVRCNSFPQARELVVCDAVLGLLRSGMMTEDYLLWIIPRLPAGLTEVYLHPTADAGASAQAGPTPTHHSREELRALTSPRVRECLDRCGVSLVEARRAGAGPG